MTGRAGAAIRPVANVIRPVAAQTGFEVRLALKQGERMLATVVIPLGILVFFAVVDVLPTGDQPTVDFLVPGVLALAVISTAMVSLGISTAFERHTGVLRRLGVTPLGRGGLVVAKTASVLVVEVLQVASLVAVGYLLGWRPAGGLAPAAGLIALGTLAFAGIGITLAGRLRGEANLAIINGLFLVFLLLGGVVIPVDMLPGPLEVVAQLLPAEPLATGLRDTLMGDAMATGRLIVLAAWAGAASLLAALTFRWD